ncbi:uncharacterized protein AB675_9085 [Cyphellophora attinorum]|uniref:UBA domain-containing protein n=1 Tax=Cyphellophora attinorum TaxID=1664694 RepID=A0A0N1NZA4_9EURO|nr:uncharacterized protein AB675_9085 [Phialophora attinorum]KPI41567.1 hypothetical protein AB675_9085 [Phialophora attinorum]
MRDLRDFRRTDVVLPKAEPHSPQLPQISRLDTNSFVDLFNRYSGSEHAESLAASAAAKDFAWPAVRAAPSLPAKHDRPASAVMVSTRQVKPVRNDSTGSSSIASSNHTSSTPTITRHSSCSSVEDKCPTPPPKDDSHSQVTALPKFHSELTESPPRPRTGTLESKKSSNPSTPNIDKPLPIPSSKTEENRAVNFSRPKVSADWQSCLPIKSASVPNPAAHRRSASINVIASALGPPSSFMAAERPRLRIRSHSAVTVAELPASLPADAPEPLAPRKPKSHASVGAFQITARTAEDVIYRIMASLERPEDLRSVALVSKGFLNTFQRNESKLVNRLMFKHSKAAWETRRSMIVLRAARDFTLCDYQRDVRTIRALKTIILANCLPLCRPRTLAGLSGNDQQAEVEVNNALWRIWTFCALFGHSSAQGKVLPGMIDWMNGCIGLDKDNGAGFAIGNGDGLTSQQLEDMADLWSCLKALLARFHGRRGEALKAGVLDSWNGSNLMTEEDFISEWTSYLMTLGPQVILALSSASYDRAKYLGLTTWAPPSPGQTRSTFLTGAVSELYQARLLTEAVRQAERIPLPRQSSHRHSRSVDESRPGTAMQRHALRLDTHAAIRQRPASTCPSSQSAFTTRPIRGESRTLAGHQRQVSNPIFPASPTVDPTFFHSLAMNRAVSTRLGATLFPVDYPTARPSVPFLADQNERQPSTSSVVVDPIDKALDLLVEEMGFPEANAKRALAMTDTGSGINVERAIELLSIQNKPRTLNTVPIELPTPVDIVAPLRSANPAGADDHCDGSCRRNTHHCHTSPMGRRASTIRRSHTRNKSVGHATETIAELENSSEPATPVSPVTDIYGGHSACNSVSSADWNRAEDADIVPGLDSTSVMHKTGRSGTKSGRPQSKAWRVLGVAQQQSPASSPHSPSQSPSTSAQKALPLPAGLARTRSKLAAVGKPKSSVVGMNEYLERIERRQSQRVAQKGWQAQSASNGGDVLGLTSSPQAQTPASPAAPSPSASTLQTIPTGNSGGLGGFRPVVAIDSVAANKGKYRLKQSQPEEVASDTDSMVAVPSPSMELGAAKRWRNVMGTVKLGGTHGHGYKVSKREKQVAKEMLFRVGERAFVG